MWGTNSLLLQKCLSGEIPPFVCCHTGDGYFCETVSACPTHLDVILLLWRTAHLILRSFVEKNDPYIAIYLVCLWEEVNSGSSYAASSAYSRILSFLSVVSPLCQAHCVHHFQIHLDLINFYLAFIFKSNISVLRKASHYAAS